MAVRSAKLALLPDLLAHAGAPPLTAVCPSCGGRQDLGLLCSACCDRLERDLGDVVAIVTDLDVTISKQARIGQSGKGGLASEKTPIHLGAVEVADNLQSVLTTWARDVSDSAGWVWVASKTPPSAQSAAALLVLVDAIRRHPAVNELVDEIHDAIYQARRVVDRPAERVYLGQCETKFEGVTCYEELWARPSASEVRCKVCGITHEVGERRAALLDRAADLVCTVQEAARYVGSYGDKVISESTIRTYVSTGQIVYHGKIDGSSAIRLGDLLTLIAENAAKPKGRKLRRAS